MARLHRSIPALLAPYLIYSPPRPHTAGHEAGWSAADAARRSGGGGGVGKSELGEDDEEASGKLILVTSVLGASANWLVVRYVVNILGEAGTRAGGAEAEGKKKDAPSAAVVLLSFARSLAFWTASCRKLGTDLCAAGRQGRFVFVDGTRSWLPAAPGGGISARDLVTSGRRDTWCYDLASLMWPGPRAEGRRLDEVLRELVAAASESGAAQHDGKEAEAEAEEEEASSRRQCSNGGAAGPATTAAEARSVVLILDGLDLYLALALQPASPTSFPPAPQALLASITSLLALRSVFVVATAAADDSFVHPPHHSGLPSPVLESNHRGFVVGLAHAAHLILSCRMLDTGPAADVSGVLRVTVGGAAGWGGAFLGTGVRGGDGSLGAQGGGDEAEEGEWLYHVASDGDVRIFGRGWE